MQRSRWQKMSTCRSFADLGYEKTMYLCGLEIAVGQPVEGVQVHISSLDVVKVPPERVPIAQHPVCNAAPATAALAIRSVLGPQQGGQSLQKSKRQQRDLTLTGCLDVILMLKPRNFGCIVSHSCQEAQAPAALPWHARLSIS